MPIPKVAHGLLCDFRLGGQQWPPQELVLQPSHKVQKSDMQRSGDSILQEDWTKSPQARMNLEGWGKERKPEWP